MKYDFDQEIIRKNTDSLKWDSENAKLPMWVADMDFEVAPCIRKALQNRVNVGAYGYSLIPDGFYKTIQRWWLERHGIGFDSEMMQFCIGVLPGITSAIRRFTAPGESILIQSPVYHMFYHLVEQAGRRVVENPLRYTNHQYAIDFEDLESKLARPDVTMMILCNPQNPTGTIWERDDLAKIGELCQRYHVLVISDEIHCDIVQPGFSYIPFAKVNETCKNNSITLVSATKAFNIAGIESACAIVPDPAIRERFQRQVQVDGFSQPNFFSADASIAAFEAGDDWLDQMNAYVFENKKTVVEFCQESLPKLHIIDSHATYLLWVDCSQITDNTDDLCDLLLKKYGLYVSKGSDFGENGRPFFRMNIACPTQQVLESLLALRKGLQAYKIRKADSIE
ncbi:MalY/PatB family protein [Catenisphaera adipataccumulans]|jgi:cystathionine beta-lyase|uniref:cysteine-S-conjugate beta-lyase n=1 Tax=Catenisphaera adipataccumulans TaxID=700500 RepID=A0A7W8CXA9_9FIRM|nr:MalY/PatB family protein [Catenisphaera adipataccumulans]MBB5183306.1 cystathionine beta-lyase [Catenisphaera adipataccumulans]